MGSSYSITNDTDKDIWVWDGVNVDAIIWGTSGAFAGVGAIGAVIGASVAASGAAAAAAAAEAAATTAAIGGATFAFTASGTVVALGSVAGASTFAGLAAGSWTVVGIATTATSAATSLILDMTVKQAEALQKATKDFLAGANKRLRPGETYHSGKMTLSLVRTCWLMNENGEQVKRSVWTAPTANANHDYKASTWAWTQPDIIKLILKYDD